MEPRLYLAIFRYTTVVDYLRQRGYVFVVVCLSVCLLATLHRNFRMDSNDLHAIFREGRNGPVNKRLNFGGDVDHNLDTGIVFRIRHLEPIRQMAGLISQHW